MMGKFMKGVLRFVWHALRWTIGVVFMLLGVAWMLLLVLGMVASLRHDSSGVIVLLPIILIPVGIAFIGLGAAIVPADLPEVEKVVTRTLDTCGLP